MVKSENNIDNGLPELVKLDNNVELKLDTVLASYINTQDDRGLSKNEATSGAHIAWN